MIQKTLLGRGVDVGCVYQERTSQSDLARRGEVGMVTLSVTVTILTDTMRFWKS